MPEVVPLPVLTGKVPVYVPELLMMPLLVMLPSLVMLAAPYAVF